MTASRSKPGRSTAAPLILDGQAIVEARLRGESEVAIMRRFGCSAADLLDALDSFARQKLHHRTRLHRVAIHLALYDELIEAHQPRARQGDVQSGMLVAKVLEQERILLGIGQQPRNDQTIIEVQSEPAKTTTDKLEAVIYALCGPPAAATPDSPPGDGRPSGTPDVDPSDPPPDN